MGTAPSLERFCTRSRTLFRPFSQFEDGSEKFKERFRQASTYHISEIIGVLQQRSDVDEDRLVAIEWHCLKILKYKSGRPPSTLQRQLATQPTFFLEVLSYAYRSKHEKPGEEEPSQSKVYMAEQAWHLLRDWRQVPGTDDQGKVNEATLREWCNEARRLADEAGRLDACDTRIGNVFAYAPEEGDGTWPCAPVRHVIEEIATDPLESGLYCGIYNSRGFGWRGSGGDQERDLAAKYRERADRIRFDAHFSQESS